MKVKELIAELEQYNQDYVVIIDIPYNPILNITATTCIKITPDKEEKEIRIKRIDD